MNRCAAAVVLMLVAFTGVIPAVVATAATAADEPSTLPTTQPATTRAAVPDDSPDANLNVQCPVMTDEAALPEYELFFRGVRVRFCCESCRIKFDRTPEPYLANLPNLPKPTTVPTGTPVETWGGRLSRFFNKDVLPFADRWQPVLAVLLGLLLVNWVAGRMVRRRESAGASGSTTPSESPRRVARLLRVLASPAITVGLVAGIVVGRTLGPAVEPAYVAGSRAAAPANENHEAQILSRLARQATLQGESFVTGLEKVYYRGNDDRSEKLYQGGIYRTCDFNVRLQTKDGKPVRPGDAVAGKTLSVRVEIVRAPNTLVGHFRDADMVKNFLISREANVVTARGNPQTAFPFRTIAPGDRWAAECDIGEMPSAGAVGPRLVTGVVLLCPGYSGPNDLSQAWRSSHYGIQYELRLEGDGSVVSQKSKLWMGATFFTSDLPDDRFFEWFSSQPLPTIPDGFRHASELD